MDWLVEKIQGFVDSGVLKGRPQHIWVNPDCGLKTRRWAEVIPSLRNMVQAAAIMRARLAGGAAAAGAGTKAAAVGAGVAGTVGPQVTGCAANGCCH